MNSGAWVSITPLQDGKPLNAYVLNEPIKDLEKRTDYLKSLLDVFGNPFSQVVVSFESVATGLEEGDVVYLGNDGKPAKASGAPDVLDEFMAGTSSYLIGIYIGSSERTDQSEVVHNVHNVSVCGQTTISLDDFARIGGTDSGVYFLSTNSGEEGQITQAPVGARILVGTFIKGDSDVKVILTPTHNSFAEAHVHRSAILSTAITSTPGAEGWHIVTGNTYYYRSNSTTLNTFWPPTPLEALTFVLDGKELVQDSDAPSGQTTYKVAYDNTQHEYLLTLTLASAPTNSVIGTTAVIHYVRGVYGETGPVTSLRASEGSPIIVKKCGTNDEFHVGDLELDLDFNAQDKDANTPGYKVYKEFKNGIFLRGPVVEKVLGGDGMDITSTDNLGHGTVVISSNANSTGQFDTVALQNAKQEMVGLFPYISLPAYNSSVQTAFVAKFQAPLTLTNTNGYKVYFYATLFGTVDGASSNYAGVSFLYNILPDGGSTDNALNVNNDIISGGPSSAIQIPFASGYTGYDPILLTNDPNYDGSAGAKYVSNLFSASDLVNASYQVAVKLTRASGTYTGAVGFLNLRWRLVPVL